MKTDKRIYPNRESRNEILNVTLAYQAMSQFTVFLIYPNMKVLGGPAPDWLIKTAVGS